MPVRPALAVPHADGGEIDYRLARRQVLDQYRRGRLGRDEVCDAHPELLRVAEHHSVPTTTVCPICADRHLVHVTFVFGPRLPSHGRCVTSRAELRALAKRSGRFSVYVIEVCPDCHWNHLARSFPLPSAT